MSRFLCKNILRGGYGVRILASNFCPLRWLSISSNQPSFTVSYLIESVGFSPEEALSASEYVDFEAPDRPDKVISVFRNFGFTQTQISRLVKGYPRFLLSDAEKIVLPKLEFLRAKGVSDPEVTNMVSAFPSFLNSSLAKRIMPAYSFFSSLFSSDERLVSVVKRFPLILSYNVEKYVAPKANLMRQHGVPNPVIATLISYMPELFLLDLDQFGKVVKEVVEMGFDPSRRNFALAMVARQGMSKSKWESKVDAYRKYGLAEEEVLEAFQRNPVCMLTSKDKIMRVMDFLTKTMGLKPCVIVQCPLILTFNLKKRVIPRCAVYQVILSKGLLRKEVSISTILTPPEKKFLQKFVTPYKEEAPELLKLYRRKQDVDKYVVEISI